MAPITRSQSRRARPDVLIKLLRTDRRHYDHTYSDGLNVCTQPWDDGHRTPGGLYACELRHLFEWISLYPDITEVAWVDVPDDAQVARFPTKIKASALVLTGSMPIAEAIRVAIQAGADVHAFDDKALRFASAYGHLAVVEFLVKAGANVHAKDDEALRWASMYGHLPVVEFLVKVGADVHALSDEALRFASEFGHLPVVEVLVTAGANVHAVDDYALHYASAHGHLPVVEFLKNNGSQLSIWSWFSWF